MHPTSVAIVSRRFFLDFTHCKSIIDAYIKKALNGSAIRIKKTETSQDNWLKRNPVTSINNTNGKKRNIFFKES